MPRSAAHQARDAALLRLMEEYPARYAELYDEEREALGLNPLLPTKRRRIAEIERTLERLRRETGEQ